MDVIFPDNPQAKNLLEKLVDEVGEELGLECGPRDKWFNDGLNFIGVQSKSDVVVFRHPYLILKAADWHEMLAHKLTAFRGDRDITDAVCFLEEIPTKDKSEVFKKVTDFRPFVPTVEDDLFESRFNQIWEKVYGKS